MMQAALMTNEHPRRALVVGLGQTGMSCVRYLRGRGYEVAVTDTRDEPPALPALRREYPDVRAHTGGLPPVLFDAADLVVVSPGLPLKQPVIARCIDAGKQVLGDIELFAREASAPIVAVTGSNGKSTVTTLVGMMCRAAGLDAAVGGNIGVPALSLLRDPEPDAYVLELSSFQLETTHRLNARAAALLNVSSDHMDRYEDVDAYATAKRRVFQGNGVMVLNADDPLVLAMQREDRPCVRFGLQAPRSDHDYGIRRIGDEDWLVRGGRALMPCRAVRLPGRHNQANALAATALAEAMGVPLPAITRTLAEFEGLPHRTQIVMEHDGVRWINDSKATNVGAATAALAGMDRPVVLVAGGQGKGADFSPLKSALAEHARAVVLIGRDAPLLADLLKDTVPVHRAADMHAAVACAKRLARPGDTVLLSPACASFDMYDNFEHRGEAYAAAVREINRDNATGEGADRDDR